MAKWQWSSLGGSAFRALIAGGLMLFLTAPGAAEENDAPASDDRIEQARERWGSHHAEWVGRFMEKNPSAPRGETVFLGDSITRGFPLDEAFPDSWAINRGIGGDQIAAVRDRLDVSITPLAPARVILLIGINDLVPDSRKSMEELEAEYRALLDGILEEAPGAQVDIVSVLPVSGSFGRIGPLVVEFNGLLRESVAPDYGLQYIDAWSILAGDEGSLRPLFTNDGVHLTRPGYAALLGPLVGRDRQIKGLWNQRETWKWLLDGNRTPDTINPSGESSLPGGRGQDQVVVYTPEYGPATTGTNEWGTEAVVSNGTAVSVGGNNSAIPADGFVISGHGEGAQWVVTNIQPGASVELVEGRLRVGPPPLEKLAPDEALETAFLQFLRWLGAQPEGNAPPPEAMAHLDELMAALAANGMNDVERLRELCTRLAPE